MNDEMTESRPRPGMHTLYVTGFLLSLVFTYIPYYLVTQKVLAGSVLLVVIIGFGVLQMLIQVLFFLHLGRKPYQPWQTGFLVATVGAIIVVVGASIWIMAHLHYNMTPQDMQAQLVNGEAIAQVNGQKTGACQEIGTNHQVILKDYVASPRHIDARQCDTLTFVNEDQQVKDMAFGEHPNHTAYAGQLDIITYNGHPETITLSQTGTYKFHDHLHEETNGDFTVTP